MASACLFCEIIAGRVPAAVVYKDEHTTAFLDHRPLFPGHVLVVPNLHIETLPELTDSDLAPLFATARMIAAAVPVAMEATGTFVAINNVISQSVPHLHIHVVPRRKGDGLKGFFWPRQPYRDDAHIDEVRRAIVAVIGFKADTKA
jgi:histidine triad (HIT) family protein